MGVWLQISRAVGPPQRRTASAAEDVASREGGRRRPGYVCEMPPMNVRGSGAWPEKVADEKSNPGCSSWKRSSMSFLLTAWWTLGSSSSWPCSTPPQTWPFFILVSCRCSSPSSIIHRVVLVSTVSASTPWNKVGWPLMDTDSDVGLISITSCLLRTPGGSAT
eukprot:GHVT01092966.1.p2 GENE.GHVT01092966.1~~GHVT01092966.1.p2  ORF type:complete len:163 (+),score=14.60 GHVT01092966.1:830-1318(+)